MIEGEGEENLGVDTSGIVCLLNGLDTPDSVITRMSNTNSQMGVVEGRWDVYEAEWTYHPDNGLNNLCGCCGLGRDQRSVPFHQHQAGPLFARRRALWPKQLLAQSPSRPLWAQASHRGLLQWVRIFAV